MEDKKEVKIITAQEARIKTIESVYLLKLAGKLIQEAANRNEDKIYFEIQDKNPNVVIKLREELEKKGYSIEFFEDEDPNGIEEPFVDTGVLVIRW